VGSVFQTTKNLKGLYPMKRLINFATSLPFVVVLGGVIVSVTAILSQYPGAINIDWGLDGGSFRIDGAPATEAHRIKTSKPENKQQ